MARVLDAVTVVVWHAAGRGDHACGNGMSLPGIRTALNVESRLDYLREFIQQTDETDGWRDGLTN